MNLASPFSLAIVAITALAFLGLPIGHAMIAGSILYLLLAGQDMGTAAEQLLNGMYTNYVILAVPLFILAAEFMNIGSMTDRLMTFCNALVGRFRGGLAQVNILQSIIFAGMSGSAIADAAGTGPHDAGHDDPRRPLHGELRGGGDGGLVGHRADHSALDPDGALRARLRRLDRLPLPRRRHPRPADGAQPDDHRRDHRAPEELSRSRSPCRCASCRGSPGRRFPSLMMPVVLLGGIYGGVMTPTEAAAVAAAYALLISAGLYRSVSWRDFYRSIAASARTTASIGMLIAGALVFNYVVTVENIPDAVKALLAGWNLSPIGFLILVNVLLLLLGCVLEGTAILLIVVPVFIPTAQALGIDLVHFGVVVVVNIMIGLITPPYGLLLFIMANISGEPLRDIVRDCMPFLFAMIVALAIITFVPETVLWLPRLLGYQG